MAVTLPSLAGFGEGSLRFAVLVVVATLMTKTVGATPLAPTGSASCSEQFASHAIGAPRDVAVVGVTPVSVSLDVPSGADIVVEALQHGNDVTLDVGATDGAFISHVDTPIRRAGRQWAIVTPDRAGLVRIKLTGKEHANVSGRVALRAFALSPDVSRRCSEVAHALATADASYARGQQVTRGLEASPGTSARHHYLLTVEAYLRAYVLLDSPADAALRATVALAIAASYYQGVKDWARSAEWAERAQAQARRVPLEYEAARAGALLAAAWIELPVAVDPQENSAATSSVLRTRMKQARALLRTLEQLHRSRHELYDATLQLNNEALTYATEGRFREAEPVFRKAAAEFGALGEWPRQGSALQNTAMCQWGLANVVAAVRTFRQALTKIAPRPYPTLYLDALLDSGLAAFAAGDLDTSLRAETQALEMARTLQVRVEERSALYGLGVTYYALGDRELARQYLDESLAVTPASADPVGRHFAMRALSAVYADDGQIEAAVAADKEALSLADSSPRRMRMLTQLAVDTAMAGRPAEALESLGTALGGPAAGDPDLRSEALIARGHIYRVAGRLDDAIGELLAAALILRGYDDPNRIYSANLELASTFEAQHKPDEALRAVDRALGRSDEVRRQSANPEFRAQRQAPLRRAYDLKLKLLADRYQRLTAAGQAAAARHVAILALKTAEHARAQSLGDLASQRYAASDPALRSRLDRKEEIYRDIAAKRFALQGMNERGEGSAARGNALKADIAAARRDLDGLTTDIARRSGVRSSTLRETPESWPAALRNRAPDGVVIDYWLGAPSAYAWTITAEGIDWTMLGDSAPITQAARRMHEAFKDFSRRSQHDRTESAAALYERIVRPLDAVLSGRRQLIVVPDGALSYIPFAALRQGGDAAAHYLIEGHDVALAPAAWWVIGKAPPPAEDQPSRLLLVSDPIYGRGDPRLRSHDKPKLSSSAASSPARGAPRQFAELERLPWTAREAEFIATLVPASQVDEFSGAAATRARLLAVDWPKYRIIHLASHAMVDSAMPQLSALLLGAYDEHGLQVEQEVRAADLESLSLRADVVTLSACDTAVGRDIVGEGAVGLASTTLARGAGAVLASLWPSSDEISARLMTEFYRGLLIRHELPLGALGSAMRSMLARNPAADPAFWAVYQLSIGRLGGNRLTREKSTFDETKGEKP